MKKYLRSLTLVLFMPLFVSAQTLTGNDLYIVHSIKNLKQIDYYLTPKGFTSIGLIAKNTAEGWDIYQFNGSKEKLEVGIGSQFNGTGELSDAILIQYYIYTEIDFNTFLNSLQNQGFTKNKEGVLKNGNPYWTYSNVEEVKMLGITKTPDSYKITILF